MTKVFIIINLLIALVLLPVAQAFVIPAHITPHSEIISDESAHCADMNIETCDSTGECETLGMHCAGSVNLAVFFETSSLGSRTKDSLRSFITDHYHYLPHFNNLRPPRFI